MWPIGIVTVQISPLCFVLLFFLAGLPFSSASSFPFSLLFFSGILFFKYQVSYLLTLYKNTLQFKRVTSDGINHHHH